MFEEPGQTRNKPAAKIDSIQMLRAIAALIVTVYHSRDVVGKDDPFKQEISFFFESGPAGVPLFFVISGFIMVYITRKTPSTIREIYQFMVKRFIRIWPTYAIITAWFYLIHQGFQMNPVYIKALIKSLLFIPLTHTDAPFYGYASLSVGWSLNYEIYFYFLIAFSLLFARHRWLVFFGLIAVTLVGIPFFAGYFTWKPDQSADYGVGYFNMITNPIIWNFVLGVVIGLIYIHPPANAFLSGIFSKRGVTSAVVLLVIWQYLSGFFGGFGPLQWGFGAAALFLAVIFHEAGAKTNYPAWLIRTGDMSFSIYLMHMPVLVSIPIIFNKLGFPVFGSGTAMLFLAISTTLILSQLSYYFLEVKLSNYIRALFPMMQAGKPKQRTTANV
ncbi:acyltransferase family protein [Dyadobacter crusticola]|uniref:acyltransferase family protein n=1 Tax=Dyadobacter crusticola TaxID=292407 RepID=UPI0004E26A6F|nr:acyltransferase [Dyadobacter crusticola]